MKFMGILMIAMLSNGVALVALSGQLAIAHGDMGMSGPTTDATPGYGGTMNVSPTFPSGTITNPAILGGTSNVSPSSVGPSSIVDPLEDIDIDLGPGDLNGPVAPVENLPFDIGGGPD